MPQALPNSTKLPAGHRCCAQFELFLLMFHSLHPCKPRRGKSLRPDLYHDPKTDFLTSRKKQPPSRPNRAILPARRLCSSLCVFEECTTSRQLRSMAPTYLCSSIHHSHAAIPRRSAPSRRRRLQRPTATRSCFLSIVNAAQCSRLLHTAPRSHRATTLAHTLRWRCCSSTRSTHASQAACRLFCVTLCTTRRVTRLVCTNPFQLSMAAATARVCQRFKTRFTRRLWVPSSKASSRQ